MVSGGGLLGCVFLVVVVRAGAHLGGVLQGTVQVKRCTTTLQGRELSRQQCGSQCFFLSQSNTVSYLVGDSVVDGSHAIGDVREETTASGGRMVKLTGFTETWMEHAEGPHNCGEEPRPPSVD